MLLNRDYDNDMHTVQTRKKTVIPTVVDKTLTSIPWTSHMDYTKME